MIDCGCWDAQKHVERLGVAESQGPERIFVTRKHLSLYLLCVDDIRVLQAVAAMTMQCAEYWVFEAQILLAGLLGTISAAAQVRCDA